MVWSWWADGHSEYCAVCRKSREQANNPLLDCFNCKDQCPALLPSNHVVWRLWSFVNSQWRMDMGIMTGLDYPAVFKIADMNWIEITPALFWKLRILETFQLTRQWKEGDK